jgi:hypothetical protein
MNADPSQAIKAVRASHSVIVFVGSPDATSVPDDEWTRYCEVCETMQRELSGSDVGRVLVVSDAVGPNARQRTQIAAIAAVRPHKSVMITSSFLVRGLVTALSWLGISMKAFSPSEWRRAFAEIDLEGADEVRRIAEAALACEEELGARLQSLGPLRAELQLD